MPVFFIQEYLNGPGLLFILHCEFVTGCKVNNPLFLKREDQIIGKFYLQKDSIWYDEVIFEEKNDN